MREKASEKRAKGERQVFALKEAGAQGSRRRGSGSTRGQTGGFAPVGLGVIELRLNDPPT
jgi:hypothetical protein